MKLLLMLLLTLITFSSEAQITGDSGSPLTMSCMVVMLLMCLLIAAVVFLVVNKNKRDGINDNLRKNT